MNAFVIGVISFLAGYFAEKTMDLLLQKLSVWRKAVSNKKRYKDISDTHYMDIQPQIRVFPYFMPQNVKIKNDEKKEQYIAIPEELKDDTRLDESYPRQDVFFRPLTIPGLPDEKVREAIEIARGTIAREFLSRKDGLYFNGKQYGVLYADGFSRTTDSSESPILHIEVFETDYYTSHVVSEAVHILQMNQDIISFDTLNSELNWLRTSLGISIIVVLKSTNEIILTHRSPSASYSDGKSWIYVSATETLTETDIDSYTQQIDLLLCLERGILEELGIPREMYIESSARFYDSFFETHFLQDGIVASIELKDTITFNSIVALPAKDKQMEVKDMFTLPNTKKAIDDFINTNRDGMRKQTIYALETYAARL